MIIAFDLDGTISDPVVGITTSINYALEKLGFSHKSQEILEAYIGPPLQEIFSDLFGKKDDELLQAAISFFRERYVRVGYQENIIYPEIEDVLDWLTVNEHTLYIATSKKTSIAKSVAEYFEITKYFKDILGCGFRRNKNELLEQIKKIEKTDNLIMVGDRRYDMQAGKESQCFCIGVLWGYGSREELLGAGADVICSNPNQLKETIANMHHLERNRT